MKLFIGGCTRLILISSIVVVTGIFVLIFIRCENPPSSGIDLATQRYTLNWILNFVRAKHLINKFYENHLKLIFHKILFDIMTSLLDNNSKLFYVLFMNSFNKTFVECNRDCNCFSTYNPTCGINKVTYVSPCYAGCKNVDSKVCKKNS